METILHSPTIKQLSNQDENLHWWFRTCHSPEVNEIRSVSFSNIRPSLLVASQVVSLFPHLDIGEPLCCSVLCSV
jgi:hypothetical protein